MGHAVGETEGRDARIDPAQVTYRDAGTWMPRSGEDEHGGRREQLLRTGTSGTRELEGVTGQLDVASRAHDDVELVAIEAVHVGDYVFAALPVRSISPRCVMAKRAKANERTERIVGWLLELAGGELTWWSRGSTVWRRRHK